MILEGSIKLPPLPYTAVGRLGRWWYWTWFSCDSTFFVRKYPFSSSRILLCLFFIVKFSGIIGPVFKKVSFRSIEFKLFDRCVFKLPFTQVILVLFNKWLWEGVIGTVIKSSLTKLAVYECLIFRLMDLQKIFAKKVPFVQKVLTYGWRWKMEVIGLSMPKTKDKIQKSKKGRNQKDDECY